MKRTATLVSVALLTALWVTPAEVHGQNSIVGSPHDFSAETWNPGTGVQGGEICKVCHTPHNSDTGVADAPLWNHQTTTATFTPYSNTTTLNASPGQPSGPSKLCLSCHDGTVALDNFNGATGGSTTIDDVNLSALVSTDLSNDHPISFDYTTALASADGELFDPSDTDDKTTDLGGSIAADLLFSNQMQCATCHDVHNQGVEDPLLRISNANSNFCLTCHKK